MTAGSSPAHPEVPARQYEDLLTQILGNALDQDYLAASRRSDRRGGHPGGSATFLVVVALFGILVGVSALQTVRDRPVEAAQRAELVDAAHQRQHQLDRLHTGLASLQGDVTALQGILATQLAEATNLSNRLTVLGVAAGTVPVTGPGVRVTTDNAANSGEVPAGVIRDSDLQQLVNGLWQAGAEAIAINGHRLTGLSSIRFAGRAITVNYQSLTPPYVIDATGNPDTLPEALIGSAAGAEWQNLRSNFGIRFDIVTEAKLTLPGAVQDQLRYAVERGSR
jgi:uncharacterized protein YlxW (UPF0749 family)